ncbi:DNA-directed RNA polymerase sigma-70 factor [Ktedonobacter sp. SOSP1-85]|uniref:RNA polymerase sigma-70 factor n=1 Tax=Ktedonobacter sp. SOSP1-85 TaxID=2778367 RepID=UPI001915D5D1|nr:RNA polymerase sigma-70 factor [Ktedonobacter sp. SOSP1-85]GHO79431.1 DNA-directed RNA polymerase sigma-70 factor [Ktedonobacter sp. SOSP1-85]
MQQEDVFQTYKPLLFSIAYNMLGNIMDAEDCVQEALLRWYQASNNGEREAVRSPKSYLSMIVTHLCIDQLRSARVQRERYIGVWLPEPLVVVDESSVTDMVELSETLSVAFLHLLEKLSPIERAVFLLRQVFDYEYAEIAAIVQKSEDNCRQIVRRARQHLGAHRPGYHASKEEQDTILHQFIHACIHGDMDGLLTLLTNDIVSYADSGGKVPSARNPLHGADRVARYLLGLLQKAPEDYHFRIARINSQPGIISYINGVPFSLLTLDILDGRIREIDVIVNPDKLRGVPTYR